MHACIYMYMYMCVCVLPRKWWKLHLSDAKELGSKETGGDNGETTEWWCCQGWVVCLTVDDVTWVMEAGGTVNSSGEKIGTRLAYLVEKKKVSWLVRTW